MLSVGETAPAFSARAGDETVSLEKLRGRNVVLFFYPGDFTTVCTKEACEFRDYSRDFENRNAVLIGVSPDDAESHKRFATQYKLDYTLLSDPEGKLAGQYGLKRLIPLLPAKRATFVIDEQGTVRAVIHKELDYRAHVERALKALDELR